MLLLDRREVVAQLVKRLTGAGKLITVVVQHNLTHSHPQKLWSIWPAPWINDQCQKLCRKSDDSSSVLRGLPRPKHKSLERFTWESIITDWDETTCSRCVRCPCHHCSTWNKRTCCRAENSTFVHCVWNFYEPQMERTKPYSKSQWDCILLGFGNATERTMKRLKLMLVELPLQEMVTA